MRHCGNGLIPPCEFLTQNHAMAKFKGRQFLNQEIWHFKIMSCTTLERRPTFIQIFTTIAAKYKEFCNKKLPEFSISLGKKWLS